MQRLFAEYTEWHTPWMARILPQVTRLAQAHPAETIFTRFVTVEQPEDARGMWRPYYQRWRSVTLAEMPAEMLDLLPPLGELVPPADVIDKTVYSPWLDGALQQRLQARQADTLIISGGETDVCVLGAVLGAVDHGYRTIIVGDALCSSSDTAHDAQMMLYRSRYGQQVEIVGTDLLIEAWR